MQAGERAVCSSIQDRQVMRFGHALPSVFVGKNRGPCGVERRVVIGMVECQWVSMTHFTGALPRPSRASLSLGHAGATKVSTTNLPSGPLSTTTLPPGPENIVTSSPSLCVLRGAALNLARILASRSAAEGGC